MKKIEPLPFHSLYEINDNMYENVIIVAKRANHIISKDSLDLQQLEEGFESTEEIEERKPEDFDKPKSIITATNEFVEKEIDWDKTDQD